MKTRFPLFALALLLPLSACETETEVEEPVTDPVVVDPVTPDPMMDDPMMDGDMTDVTAQSTLDAAQQAGGLTQLAVPAAIDNIDSWIAQLEGNAQASGVVDGLRTLRTQLQANPIDGAAVGATLTDLGSQTTAAAAGDGSLEQLGAALTEAGQMLTGGM